MNHVILTGRVAAEPEVREYESGARWVRVLVTTRSKAPKRRVDVIPVTYWLADGEPVPELPLGGEVVVIGQVQRRFWAGEDGRRNRLEVVASTLTTSMLTRAAEELLRHYEAEWVEDPGDRIEAVLSSDGDLAADLAREEEAFG